MVQQRNKCCWWVVLLYAFFGVGGFLHLLLTVYTSFIAFCLTPEFRLFCLFYIFRILVILGRQASLLCSCIRYVSI